MGWPHHVELDADMIPTIELYGAHALCVGGLILATAAVAAILNRHITGSAAHPCTRALSIGLLGGSCSLTICGALITLVFEGTDGIERVIGNLMILAAPIMSMGIGLRATRVSLSLTDKPML